MIIFRFFMLDLSLMVVCVFFAPDARTLAKTKIMPHAMTANDANIWYIVSDESSFEASSFGPDMHVSVF